MESDGDVARLKLVGGVVDGDGAGGVGAVIGVGMELPDGAIELRRVGSIECHFKVVAVMISFWGGALAEELDEEALGLGLDGDLSRGEGTGLAGDG